MAKEKISFSIEVFFPAIMENKKAFKGKAISISTENKLGKFDVLPQHINFITLIFKNLSIETVKKEKFDYRFEKGILIVKENKVSVFLGI